MDASCLDFTLTEKERIEFDKNGFFIVEDVLPPKMVDDLLETVDRVYDKHLPERGLDARDNRLNLLGFVGEDESFLELLDWPKTFAKVWGILGWNIQLYHSHMIITPPLSAEQKAQEKRIFWHQDSGRLNLELEMSPQPRISLKVAYFLTDTSVPGRGNFRVVPGSHLRNEVDYPDDGVSDPQGAVDVRVKPGTAVFFDRRIWHAASRNVSDITRKGLFYGYSYRWLRPRDDMSATRFMDRCDPIRQQLLGASPNGGFGYTSPKDEDVPLKTWIEEHLGQEAVAP